MRCQSTRSDNSIQRFASLKLGIGGASVGRLVSLAVLLGLTLFSGVVFTARAQSIDREIAGLTLSGDSPGELLISWDEPSPAPYDYRVNWGQEQRGLPFVAEQRWECVPDHQLPHGHRTGRR